MKKRKIKKMWIALSSVILLIAAVVVFFRVPYSPTRARFESLTSAQIDAAEPASGVFSEADIAGLPVPVQRYFKYCGYLGTPKMSYMTASFRDVDFVMSPDRTVKIDYEQFNLVARPERYALISSSLYGVPFEGLDTYAGGVGGMKGTLAKLITLFDQRGAQMDRACLVTWLSESLMFPNAALQDFVTWEMIDDTHAKASIAWEGVSASGIFTFSETGELLSFRTSDRTAIDMNGKERQADWSAFFRAYYSVNGILKPEILQSVWHYPEGDCVYFNENEAAVEIR